MLRFIYVLFLGFVLALFVGLGTQAFYPFPNAPEYPITLEYREDKAMQDSDIAIQKQFDADQKTFEQDTAKHSRNVSIIAIIASIIYMALSLTVLTKIPTINDGVLLGGLLTMVYSIITGIMSSDNVFRFLLVTIGLIVALVLGYFKFIKPREVHAKA